MKKNYIIAIVLLAICFGLLITSMVFTVMENNNMSTYFAMGATGAGFFSCLFGINSWREKN